MAEQSKLTGILELLSEVVRWWGLPAAGAAIGISGGLLAFGVLPKTYEATTTILVTPSRIPLDFGRSTMPEDMSLRPRTIKEEVCSRPYMLKLIEDVFGQPADPNALERMIPSIRGRLTVEVLRTDERQGSGVFALTYRDVDPERAAKVANRLGVLYVEENIRLRTSQAQTTADTLLKLADEVAIQLAVKDKEIADFRARHPYEQEDHLPANLQLLAGRRTEQDATQRELAAAQDRLSMLNTQRDQSAQIATVSPTAGRTLDQIDPRLIRLAALERELESQLSRYTEEHPSVKSTRRQVEELRGALRANPPMGVDPNDPLSMTSAIDLQIDAQRREVARLKNEIERIRTDIALYEARVEATPRVEQKLAELTKGYAVLNQQYEGFRRNYEQARGSLRIEESRKGEQFEVIEKATPPAFPVEPNRIRLCMIGLSLGLVVFVGPLALIRFFRPTVSSEAGLQISLPGIPVLASLAQIETHAVRRRARLRLAANIALSATALVVFIVVAMGRAPGGS